MRLAARYFLCVMWLLLAAGEMIATAQNGILTTASARQLTTQIAIRLEAHVAPAHHGLWVGNPNSQVIQQVNPVDQIASASAIKIGLLMELFSRYSVDLDKSTAELSSLLEASHPAVAHFRASEQQEILVSKFQFATTFSQAAVGGSCGFGNSCPAVGHGTLSHMAKFVFREMFRPRSTISSREHLGIFRDRKR